jgi:hypothetical protein
MATVADSRVSSDVAAPTPTTAATKQSTLLVICDELTTDQEAAVLALHPESTIITEKSPELALTSVKGRRRIRDVAPDNVVIVVHDGCSHLARSYAYRGMDYATRRKVWNLASAQTIKVRRNNHLWLGILELKRSFSWNRRTVRKRIQIDTLVVRDDNSVEAITPVDPRTWNLNRACGRA